MAGIYLHIPFCKQKCHYCNFFSLASRKHLDTFGQALINEMESRKDYLLGKEIGSIYFGGGTPSLLSAAEINRILGRIYQLFRVSADAEITLEANPDDCNERFLEEMARTPVNRLSIGIQSFFDDDLRYLHRVHTGEQAMKVVHMARSAGFNNLTVDLIYGIPGLSNEKWQRNLDQFFELGLPHLSAYALTVEQRTALRQLINKGKLPEPDENVMAAQFGLLLDRMEQEGFVHYEISNFAKPGHYSRHNSLYWLGGHYLGLGPSAHSFNGSTRQWNLSHLEAYMKGAAVGGTVEEVEVLSEQQQYNEYVMTSLRTSWGCDLQHIRNVFGDRYADYCMQQAKPWIAGGKLDLKHHSLLLAKAGKFFADGIASDLFMQ